MVLNGNKGVYWPNSTKVLHTITWNGVERRLKPCLVVGWMAVLGNAFQNCPGCLCFPGFTINKSVGYEWGLSSEQTMWLRPLDLALHSGIHLFNHSFIRTFFCSFTQISPESPLFSWHSAKYWGWNEHHLTQSAHWSIFMELTDQWQSLPIIILVLYIPL